MVIGLSGEDRNLVAAYLIKEHGFERRAFADPVKRVIAASFRIPYDQIDQLKRDPDLDVVVESIQTPTYHVIETTFKEFIAEFAEGHKEVFGEDFWLQYTLPLDGYYAGKKIVVTDVRFDNEANRVRMVGGFVVGIGEGTEDHVDHWIASGDDLYRKIDVMLEVLGDRDYQVKAIVR